MSNPIRNLPDKITPSKTVPTLAALLALAAANDSKRVSVWSMPYPAEKDKPPVTVYFTTEAGTTQQTGEVPTGKGVVTARLLGVVVAPGEPITRNGKARKTVEIDL